MKRGGLVLLMLLMCVSAQAGQGLTPDDKEAANPHPPSRDFRSASDPGRDVEGDKQRLRELYEVLSEPETAVNMADYAKHLYDELRARGFSGPDALRLTANMPLPEFQP